MALDLDVEFGAFVKKVIEVVLVELSTEKGVAMHYESNQWDIERCIEAHLLPVVRGVNPWKPLSATLCGVSVNFISMQRLGKERSEQTLKVKVLSHFRLV